MSIDIAFDNVSIALKNLWQACFMDEDGKSLDWTSPLITSINTPKLKLTVTATDGGAMKSYTGYELPENISITIYETPDRKVEKYLDGWMFGPKGVFNKETGKFRARSSDQVTNIYRCIKFSTFIWENDDPSAGDAAGVKTKNPDIEETAANVLNRQMDIEEIQADTSKKQPDIEESSANAVKKEPSIRELASKVWPEENSKSFIKPLLASQQVIAQLTSLVSGVANQALGKIPAMAVGRVIIPPPVVRVPLAPAMTLPKYAAFLERSIKERKTEETGSEENINTIKKWKTLETGDEESIDSIKTRKTLESGSDESVDTIKLRKTLETGEEQEESTIKKFKHKEKIMTTSVYTCAIEGYDVASYDYETGGPVSYTVNLSVLNYKPS